MPQFQIRLAGRIIAVRSIYEEVLVLCRDYLSEEPEEDFRVEIQAKDIEFERKKSFREAMLEGHTPEYFPDSYLETLAVYRKIALRMPDYDTWLMHGSAVAVDGEAYLFTAPSGTGKTTHTRLWLEQIPGAFVVNGDKPLLRLQKDVCRVCGTPWSGKEGLNRNTQVPLRCICFLERGKENRIAEISFREALPMLLQQSYRPTDAAAMQKTMALVHGLKDTVRFFHLHCNMDPSAALVAWGRMHG